MSLNDRFYVLLNHPTKDGKTVNLIEIQPALAEEWNALTPDEKNQIIDEFDEDSWNDPVIKRPSVHSRISDVSNVKRNMQALV